MEEESIVNYRFFFFYYLGKFSEPPQVIKTPFGQNAHKCIRKLFDFVKSHLAHFVLILQVLNIHKQSVKFYSDLTELIF